MMNNVYNYDLIIHHLFSLSSALYFQQIPENLCSALQFFVQIFSFILFIFYFVLRSTVHALKEMVFS